MADDREVLLEHRFSVSANPNGLGVFGFQINPLTHEMRPARDQNFLELIDGSIFILEPEHDSTRLTLTWSNLPEGDEDGEDFGRFIFGNHEDLHLDRAFFYRELGTTITIHDMTYETQTNDTVGIPFVNDGSIQKQVAMNEEDRFFLGAEDQFFGILWDFKDYHSNLFDSDNNLKVDEIELRFPPSSGDLASGNTITYDGTQNVDDDDTDLWSHYGQTIWRSSQVESWEKVTLNDILDNTAGLSRPTGFSNTTELYWVEVKITPDNSIASVLDPNIQAIKVALDSLDALASRKSNGILPIWWINVPEVLKRHRPRGFRDSEWIGCKITNFEARLVNPTQKRWDIIITFVPIDGREANRKFTLDVSNLDGDEFLA
jgi:hypothetical protein